MKVRDVLALVDKAYNNDIEQGLKITLLQELDRKIVSEIFETHEGEYPTPESEYTESTELLVGSPYTDLYSFYLQARLCLLMKQNGMYSAYVTMFENEYSNFARDYNRKHRAKQTVRSLKLI